MARFSRRSFLQATGLGATALTTSIGMPAIIRSAHAAGGTVKLGCLFSSSGTMANIEGRLNYVVRMAADEINAKGGVNGRTIEVAVSDPASDWPLYAQVGKQMLEQDKVAALFGCWTSVSRKTVLPVVEQANGLLFYPLHFEGDENSKNVVYVNSPPASSVLPAVDYLMSEEGVSAKRFFMLGSDYVWPRTINKQLKGYWKSKGIAESAWKEEYVPLGFSNFQTLVNQIRAFADAGGGKPIVVLTVVGSSIPDFLREYANQGIKAPANVAFLKQWADYVKANNVPFKADVAIDPMVSAYDAVHLWAMAAAKANSFEVPEVTKAFAGLSFDCPSGYKLAMTAENNYVSRGVFIGSVNEKQGFDILWQSKDAAKPVPFSPYG